MSRGLSVLLSSCVVALLAAAPAAAAQTISVTATGTAQAKVLPKNRHTNASIQTAYDAAQAASITGAINDAHEYALDCAQDGGLTLGALVSVSDQQSNGFYGPGFGGFAGPFGPGQFCGTVHQPIFKRVNGRRKVVGFKKVHRCFVPQFAYTTLALTYSAAGPVVTAQTSTVTATGTGQARVLPKNRHSNASIQTAYDAAQRASIPGAIRDAQEYALDYAQQGGLTLGALVSVSDQQSNGFYGPGAGGFAGPFGPGQFCGTDQQPIFKRVNGRQKLVGFKKVHRCIVPPFAYTTLTLTYSAS